MPPMPALNNRIRNEIGGTLIDGPSVWGAKEGEPNRDDFLRVVAASLEPLVKIKEIELRYMRRMTTAFENQDTIQLMAAVYGLQSDMRGGVSFRWSVAGDENEFFRTMFMRAMRIASHNKISKWFDDKRFSALGNMRERRALAEYFEEKLVELDAAVLLKYPPGSDEPAGPEAAAPKI